MIAVTMLMAGAVVAGDVHSRAEPDKCRVTHLKLDLTVDFEGKRLHGTATLGYQRAVADAPLILDAKGLVISAVTAGGKPVPYRLEAEDPILGSALRIEPPAGEAGEVTVAYATGPGAPALQWVEPSGTVGKQKPFLFTQAQAIHARSFVPIQDSPAVRFTYEAIIRTPADLRAIMAADLLGGPPGEQRFRMPQAIPSYLLALAVGDLQTVPLGPRSAVHAEPGMIKAAAEEFSDIEAMIAAVEKRFGPYAWGRYDVLVLPPSFPFGGMENPKVTFATPTIIAGDKSLVSLIAHELAHSWSGNLVTNATWRDFWLNEGFTVYLERRIIEDLYGPDRAAMEAVLGLTSLREDLAKLPPEDQVLQIDLKGRDPDEGVTQVPYEKGALFLSTIERAYGRAKFDEFLAAYFAKFRFQSITTEQFLAFLKEQLLAQNPEAAGRLDLEAWLHKPGLPAEFAAPESDKLEAVKRDARAFVTGAVAADGLKTAGWTTHEWLHFLNSLPANVKAEQLAALDGQFQLTASRNSEIAQHWLVLTIRAEYAPAAARLEEFLTTIGRRKFLMPLYTELLKAPGGKARAEAIFAKARAGYHPIAAESVHKLLSSPPRPPEEQPHP